MRAALGALALAGLCVAGAAPARAQSLHLRSDDWGRYELYHPDRATPRGLVFLLSAAPAPDNADRLAAQMLADAGFAAALVDTAQWTAHLRRTEPRCAEYFGALEWTAHLLQRELQMPGYVPFWVAGRGAGAAVTRAVLAQAPADGLAGGIGGQPVSRAGRQPPPCPPQVRDAQMGGAPWYALPELDAAASSWGELLRARIAPPQAAVALPAGMPVIEVAHPAQADTLLVIWSGDGGWRDLDRTLGDTLGARHVAVIGVDSLRYFWRARTPEAVADDLDQLLGAYGQRWNIHRYALVGYSFGADVLPFAYNRLGPGTREHVALLALLAPGRSADFEVHISGWLTKHGSRGAHPLAPELPGLTQVPVLCVYGQREADTSLCTLPAMHAAHLLQRPGGHHFDGHYEVLARAILALLRPAAGVPG